MDASGGEAGDQGSLSRWISDIGIPIHFQKSQASSHFEALNSVCLSRYQSDVIPPIQMSGELRLSLGSPQGIQTSLHLVR